MSRAYPYRRPPGDVVAEGPWLLVGTDVIEELADDLPSWDYDSVLRLRRPMRVDGLRARRSCGLGDDAEIVLSVVWAATSSALRGRSWRIDVAPRDGFEFEIEFELSGGELGGRLDLETILSVGAPGGGTPSHAAPTRPGSVLWKDVRPVLLQGDAVLFPLCVVDFAELPYPDGAAWHLELGHDLEAQALGSILLLANERRHAVRTALESAANPDEGARRVLSMIRSDVTRALLERALAEEEFDPGIEFPTGSVGALLAAVVTRTFPDREMESLRRERNHEPILFATRVQHATDLLADP